MHEILRDTFRNLTMPPYQRKIEQALRNRYPEAAQVLATLHHPRLITEIKRGPPFAYGREDGGITLVTQENARLDDDADRVFAAMIGEIEKRELADNTLRQRREDIYSRLYVDYAGNRTRFTFAGLESAPPDRNSGILRRCAAFLQSPHLPQCAFIYRTLSDDHVTLNIRPVENAALEGGFSLDTGELTLYYDPSLPDEDVAARVVLTLMHETCHYNQEKNGLLAEEAREPDNYRELYHLNELQAHTIPYKTVLEILARQPFFDDVRNGHMTVEDLARALNETDGTETRICRTALCETGTGNMILHNIQARYKAGIAGPFDAEALTKEALCHGAITAVENGTPAYDSTVLARMQRYAHSHIAVMNYGEPHGRDRPEKIATAIRGHFNGPLGLSRYGNVVNFADGDLTFTSAVTHRALTVAAIESIWARAGSDTAKGLGIKSEQILNAPAPENRKAVPVSPPYTL